MNCKNTKDDFWAYLHSHLDYSPGFYKLISPTLHVLTLNNNELILSEGEVCREAFWLQSGYGRYFRTITDEEGFVYEETIDFCKAGRIIFISGGFFDDSPSKFSFELAKGAVLIPFTKRCYESLIHRMPETATIANIILALDKAEGIKKMDMMKMKPRERYREFLSFFGVDIEQKFAVKQIASHLGLQPSYLSRLRGEVFRNNSGLIKCLQAVFFASHFI